MFNIEITISGPARATLLAVRAIIRFPADLLLVVGREASEVLRKHFAHLDRIHPNKLGGKRTQFWDKVRSAVQNPAAKGRRQVVVAINHPVIAHKVGIGPAGGWIQAKRSKWLTIPVIAEAYGKTAREYESGGAEDKELTFIPISDEKALLAHITVEVTAFAGLGRRAKTKRNLEVVFVLRKKVYQKGQKDALPNDAAWTVAIGGSATDFIEREVAKKGS